MKKIWPKYYWIRFQRHEEDEYPEWTVAVERRKSDGSGFYIQVIGLDEKIPITHIIAGGNKFPTGDIRIKGIGPALPVPEVPL